MSKPNLICLIPVHNEESHFLETLAAFEAQSPLPIKKFVLCENGSSDGTLKILGKLQAQNPERYEVISIPQADFGLALRHGLAKICQMSKPSVLDELQWIQFNGADIPFGTSDLRSFEVVLAADPMIDLVLGSKLHRDSHVSRGWRRSAATRVFYFLRLFFTGMRFRDTQGTLFFKLSNARKMSPCLRTRGFVTTTEMIFWHHIHGKKIVEVPVTFRGEKRPSSVRIIKNGIHFIKALTEMNANRRAGKYGES